MKPRTLRRLATVHALPPVPSTTPGEDQIELLRQELALVMGTQALMRRMGATSERSMRAKIALVLTGDEAECLEKLAGELAALR